MRAASLAARPAAEHGSIGANPANLQGQPSAWPAYRCDLFTPSRSGNDLVTGKELGDLLFRRFRRIRAVHRVFAHRVRVQLANRSVRSVGRIGGTHDVAIAGNRVVALE